MGLVIALETIIFALIFEIKRIESAAYCDELSRKQKRPDLKIFKKRAASPTLRAVCRRDDSLHQDKST